MAPKLFVFIFLLFCRVSFCQDGNSPNPKAGPVKDNIKPVDSIKPVTDSIEKVWNLNSKDDTVRSEDVIGIKLRTEKKLDSFSTLYVNGIKVDQAKPWRVSESERTIFFKLDDKVTNITSQFFGDKSTNDKIIPAYFTVGTVSRSIPKPANAMNLVLKQKIKPAWAWIMFVILVMLTALALYKNVLKDDNNLYYSLGRVQLFYWTMLFVVCYIFLCFSTNTLPDIPTSTLIILGISIGTTAAAKIVDNEDKRKVKIDPDAKSEGFIMDILSDGTSINIHRFQNVIFHLVFGLIFIQKAISTSQIPDFDDTILLLLGISSGAYATLKITEPVKEQQKPPPQTGTDPPPEVSTTNAGVSNATVSGNTANTAAQPATSTVTQQPINTQPGEGAVP